MRTPTYYRTRTLVRAIVWTALAGVAVLAAQWFLIVFWAAFGPL